MADLLGIFKIPRHVRFLRFKRLVQQISGLRGLQSGQEVVSRKQQPRLRRDALAHLGSTWRRVSPALEELMASVSPASAQAAEASSTSLPWYVRYTRWKPTSRAEAVAAERNLLSLCSTPLEVSDVAVGKQRQQFMHTISAGPANAPPMVLVPGYGAGAAFYFRNLDGLAVHFRTHAVDLLGTGMSGRPNFSARSREEAEGFFVDALARWREAMGVDRMVLVGHSLGGYLAASYALQHPEHVQHLVLVGPAGVPQDDGPRSLPEASRWSVRGQLYHLSRSLWDAGATPGAVIRSLGPWGPSLIQKYARNRFREGMGLSQAEVAAFEEYFYHIMAARGSGEHALRHLLAPFARAKHPLEGRLHDLKVPVSFIYGDSDWMEPAAGQRVARAVLEHRGRLSPTDGEVDLVERAGHYAFLDQPQEFLQKLLSQTLTAFPDWDATKRRPDQASD
ncbi:hypothetical protein WJX75_000828 [Coccomyxa subellipsoidea]|uniref:AB hydrolase-1 domain-containing protein n=1 Tax=Coccomyxa subellipsoidea TaxID=248742 RepID=A0ABR2YZK2_9CHLO